MVDSLYEKKIQSFARSAFRNCKKKERKLLTEQLIDDMHTYLESNPNTSFENLARHFSENSEPLVPNPVHHYGRWIGIGILILILGVGTVWYVSSSLSSDNGSILVYTEESAP